MNPIGYPKLHPVGSDLAPYERRSDRSGSQREPTCNRLDRSECFVGPTSSRSTRSRGVDRAQADRLHTLPYPNDTSPSLCHAEYISCRTSKLALVDDSCSST